MGNYELRTFTNADELARVAAAEWLAELSASSQPYYAAFSGGRIARNFCREIKRLNDATTERPLQRVHFFWADERSVPPSNSESNYRLVFEELLQPAGVSEG